MEGLRDFELLQRISMVSTATDYVTTSRGKEVGSTSFSRDLRMITMGDHHVSTSVGSIDGWNIGKEGIWNSQ